MEIDNAIEMIHGMEDELDQVKKNARAGNLHCLPGETVSFQHMHDLLVCASWSSWLVNQYSNSSI